MSRRQKPIPFRRSAASPPAVAGHRPLLLAAALAAGFSALPAHAQPSGAQAIVGTASLSQQGSRLVVTTQNGAGTSYSAINWQSFSVPAGTSTHVAQPGLTSTSINRVIGPDPSAIFGTLSSNGRLVLVNPAGITVGAGAVVDTAAFTASTLRMSDADALAGRLRFSDGSGAPLRVEGQVLARQGDVVLIGQDLQTGSQALVQSPQGATLLAAGQKVEVTGRGLEGIVFELQAPADQALNLGTLRGDAVGVFAGTLKHSGVIQAQAVSTEGGKVVLRATDTAQAAGTIQAQGLGGAGGSVDLLGSKVGVLAGATVDTSNSAGGGRIRIGGDFQGGHADVPNAQVTYLDRNAQLRANATVQGDGGRVIVWADDTTRAYGRIEANAGPRGGNGGFVETSGKRHLDVNGIRVQASAVGGATGTWLLDPDDITIAAGSEPSNIDETPANLFQPIDNGYQSMLYDATLNAALDGPSGVNVVVKTGTVNSSSFGSGSGDITVLGGVNLQRTAAGSATLTLDAYNDIRFSSGTTTFGARDPMPSPAPVARTLNVVLKAGANGTGSIITDQGAGVQTEAIDGVSSVNIQANLSASVNKRWTNNGDLMLGAAGLVDLGTIELLNQGYVGGWDGTLKVATFNQPAPAPSSPPATLAPYGSMSLEVTRSFNVSDGEFDFNGANLTITQQSGDLTLAGGMYGIGATGAVKLTASVGKVSIPRHIQAGSIDIKATGDIDTWSLSTLGVYNGQTGTVSLDAGGHVDYGQINTSGNGTYGTAGGAVTIKGALGVAGGTINTYGYYDGGNGGAVSVTSQGDIDLGGGIDTAGGYNSSGAGGTGGAVSIASSGGNVSSGWIDTYGGSSWGGAGGHGGAVTVSGNAIRLSDISTTGGDSGNGIQGGTGGAVNVTAASGLSFIGGGYPSAAEMPSYGSAWIDTGGGRGGDNTGPGAVGGAGGNAGAVAFTVNSGLMDLSNVAMAAWGGDGGAGGSVGGAGGSGGAITLRSLNGSIATSGGDSSSELPPSFISSGGGWGGDTVGLASTDRGGRGGDAKAITIVAGSSSALLGEIWAQGGGGGYASSAGARGGAGGNGAAITISGAGPVVLAGGISAAGGDGGLGFDPSDDGVAGNTGTFTTSVTGGITIPSAPVAPTVGTAFDPGGMSSLNIDARWINNGSVLMAPSSWVLTSQPVTNNGTLDLGAGSVLTLGSYDRASDTFIPGGSSLTNAAGAVLKGQGTVEASTLFNAGTLLVGDSASSPSSPIGTFSIAGDLVQQATGKLVFDIAANTPYQPGVTYDQLRVSGSAVLDGTLQVNAIAAVSTPTATSTPTAPDSPPGALASALPMASSLGDTYVLMDVGGSVSGSFAAYVGPADVVPLLQMSNAGSLQAIPGAVVPPGPTPPPTSTPTPVVLASDPLVDKVLGLLDGAASRDQVQAALSEQNTLVAQALGLLLDEEERQKKDGARGDVVYTDAACKPS